MNYTKQMYCALALIIASAMFSACSKKSDIDGDTSGKSGVTMTVNGAPWNSWMTTLFTEKHESSSYGEYYLISLVGTGIIEKNSVTEDDLSESITIGIAIPASKFDNPKGTYPILTQSEAELNQACAIFGSSTDIRDASLYGPSISGSSGTIEITGFEIGQQTVLGHETGSKGYTRLSGTFRMELDPVAETGANLKITEGKFNVVGGMAVGQ